VATFLRASIRTYTSLRWVALEALVNQSKSGLLQARAQYVEVKAAFNRSKGLFDQNVTFKGGMGSRAARP